MLLFKILCLGSILWILPDRSSSYSTSFVGRQLQTTNRQNHRFLTTTVANNKPWGGYSISVLAVVPSRETIMTMKDHSASAAFKVGDSVQVVENVIKAGSNLKGRIGRVVELWEKCDVDPACCCAEQVNPDMAVHVEFIGTDSDGSSKIGLPFTFYFSEDELRTCDNEDNDQKSVSLLPFDGMSCTTFKMNQLQIEEKTRKLASSNPNQIID